MSSPRLRVINNAGNTIRINNDFDIVFQTQLLNDTVSGTSVTYAVDAVNGFVAGQTVSGALTDVQCYIGNLGAPNCEAVTFTTSSITNNTMSFSNANYNHNKSENVTFVAYNAVDLYKNGSFLVRVFLQQNQEVTLYKDLTGTTSDSYAAAFVNQKPITPVIGTLSTSVPAISYDTTAGYIIDAARTAVGNVNLSDDFFMSALNDARKIINTDYSYGYLWDWRQKFNYPIKMTAGKNYIDLPSDIDFNTTNRSILNARYVMNLLTMAVPLKYIDKSDWNTSSWRNIGLDVVGYTGATITLNNTSDLPASGSIMCSAIDSTGIMTLNYTANNTSTNTLSGLTGATRVVNVGDQVWAGVNFAYPSAFTIFGNRMYFNTTIPNVLHGKSVYIDYYTKLVQINDITDNLPEHYRDVFKHYLKFAAKRRRNDSIGTDDPDYKQFLTAIEGVIQNSSYNNDIRITNG